MAVPDFYKLRRPFLEALLDGKPKRVRDIGDEISKVLNLTDDDLAEMLPSGTQTRFTNRVHWTRTYLSKADFVESPSRGYVQITEVGRGVLKNEPGDITDDILKQSAKFTAFVENASAQVSPLPAISVSNDRHSTPKQSPEEEVGQAIEELRRAFSLQLLDRVKNVAWEEFEELVVQLLVAMGYGSNRYDAAQALKKSGDGGIDGIIKQDPLGLENIYVQAKRYADGTVGRPIVQQLSGSLKTRRVGKGILITTSNFTKEAIIEAEQARDVTLIDGQMLTQLMLEYGVGVRTKETYKILEIDENFFDNL